jgi:hypothetical protein
MKMQRIRALIVNNLWWVVLIVAAAMLVVHGLGVRLFVVDNTSLILLALVLISPFVAAIKKIKIGDFEAEIDPEEVKEVARQAEKAVPESSADGVSEPGRVDVGATIRSLAEADPVVALAKLRIEIESKLRRLHELANPSDTQREKAAPLSLLIRNLVASEVILPDLGSALRSVVSICNRAVHGEEIREADAEQMIESGIGLLEDLERTLRGYATNSPVEVAPVTPGEYDRIQGARYRLTTVVPIVDNPVRHVYVLTQEELEEFFDGYAEFAEFAVGLEMLT